MCARNDITIVSVGSDLFPFFWRVFYWEPTGSSFCRQYLNAAGRSRKLCRLGLVSGILQGCCHRPPTAVKTALGEDVLQRDYMRGLNLHIHHRQQKIKAKQLSHEVATPSIIFPMNILPNQDKPTKIRVSPTHPAASASLGHRIRNCARPGFLSKQRPGVTHAGTSTNGRRLTFYFLFSSRPRELKWSFHFRRKPRLIVSFLSINYSTLRSISCAPPCMQRS